MRNDSEAARVGCAMLEALEQHGEETGHDVSQFIVPNHVADCICAFCGTVVYEGEPFEADA